jgi:hypothetical protein
MLPALVGDGRAFAELFRRASGKRHLFRGGGRSRRRMLDCALSGSSAPCGGSQGEVGEFPFVALRISAGSPACAPGARSGPLGDGPKKHAANRPLSPIARSVAPNNSSPPASFVAAPPSNAATTARDSTRAKSNVFALHSVGIGELLCCQISLCCRRTLSDSEPRCTYSCEISGLAIVPRGR